jgi:uncharacterized membrane protein
MEDYKSMRNINFLLEVNMTKTLSTTLSILLIGATLTFAPTQANAVSGGDYWTGRCFNSNGGGWSGSGYGYGSLFHAMGSCVSGGGTFIIITQQQ